MMMMIALPLKLRAVENDDDGTHISHHKISYDIQWEGSCYWPCTTTTTTQDGDEEEEEEEEETPAAARALLATKPSASRTWFMNKLSRSFA